MSMFGDIMSAIFGAPKAKATTSAPGSVPSSPQQQSTMSGSMPQTASATPTPPPMSRADVEGMIARIAAQQSSKYNWNESIVDLMKLLKLDSSLAARKQLAQELGYSGPLDGSAEMNTWLHKEVMAKLAAGGGKFTM